VHIEKDQLVTLGMVVALGALFAVGVWMPARERSVEIERRITAAKSELGMTAVAKDELTQLNAQVTDLRKVVSGAQRYVPVGDEIAEVVRGVNEALREHGVTEQEMIARSTRRFADHCEIPLTVEYRSSFPVVFGALRQIESMPRLIRVDRLTLSSNPADPAKPLDVHIQMTTFYTLSEGAR
jgi:Tfp pilus assembly protein PilO